MQVETFFYTARAGWSVESFPALDSEQTLVLIFFSPEFINQTKEIDRIIAFYPTAKIMGCSTAGEIIQANVKDASISVAVLKFEKTALESASAEISNVSESNKVGQEIARALNKDQLKGILVLSDGLNVNGTELVAGINSIIPKSVVVTGGLAGDGANFRKTWIIAGNEKNSHLVCAIGFYGNNIHIGHGSEGGWEIFGTERSITRSIANVVYEIDKQPALQLYKQYLGERAVGLPATALLFPLAITSESSAKPLVRTILSIDEAAQSMTFAGDVPQGAKVRLMKANFEKLIQGAAFAANMASMLPVDKQTVTIAVSCVGRRLILGERIEEELEAALAKLPKNTKQIGFYSYGEISPREHGGFCDLHNQTMTLTVINEY